MTPKELHKWYLEATSRLNFGSFNQNAQKPYEELTVEQKFIDEYISNKIKAKVKETIWKLVDKITKYNLRNWSGASHNQREIWKGMINMWIKEIDELEKELGL